jgi:hypothetical protein
MASPETAPAALASRDNIVYTVTPTPRARLSQTPATNSRSEVANLGPNPAQSAHDIMTALPVAGFHRNPAATQIKGTPGP